MNLALIHGERLDPIVRAELEQLIVGITAHWMVDHALDGTHTLPALGVWHDLSPVDAWGTDNEGTTTFGVSAVTAYAYTLIGKTCGLIVNIGPGSVTRVDGVPESAPLASSLTVALPPGVVAARTTRNACAVTNAGTKQIGTLRVKDGARVVEVLLPTEGSWAESVNGTGVTGQIWFPVRG